MRSFLTALGIAAAVGSLVAMVGLSRGLERGWLKHFHAKGTDLVVLQKGAVEIFTSNLEKKSVMQSIGSRESRMLPVNWRTLWPWKRKSQPWPWAGLRVLIYGKP
ncbi:MAG: ABC transporter permease [Thermodesulfobacteriota bacterium]